MSRSQKEAAVYAIIMGIGMIGWWAAALLSDQIPELHTTPIQALLHITAEGLTGAALIAGGFGLLAGRWWATRVHLFSLGMLLYAVIQVAGYSAERGQVGAVILFVAIFLATLFLLYRAARSEGEQAWAG